MSNYITVHGFASADVDLETKESGLVIGRLRLGSTDRVKDSVTQEWKDGATNWFRVNLFRSLAQNVAASVHKGDRVVVTGKLRIKTWLKLDGSHGLAVEIDADTVGNDLKFGTCTYHRHERLHQTLNGQRGEEPAGPAAPRLGPPVGAAESPTYPEAEPAYGASEATGDLDDAEELEESGEDLSMGPLPGPAAALEDLGDGTQVDTGSGEVSASAASAF